MRERLLRIHNAPAHRWGAWAMLFNELCGKAVGVSVQHISDVTLLPKLNGLRLVVGHMRIPHPLEQGAQFFWVRAGEFYEFEPVGACGVLLSDL